MKHYKDKVLITGYLSGVQGDLESRLEVLNETFTMNETREERKEALKNHVKILKLTKNFLHELWDDYFKLLKEKDERSKAGLL